jgi:hypothetical protein
VSDGVVEWILWQEYLDARDRALFGTSREKGSPPRRLETGDGGGGLLPREQVVNDEEQEEEDEGNPATMEEIDELAREYDEATGSTSSAPTSTMGEASTCGSPHGCPLWRYKACDSRDSCDRQVTSDSRDPRDSCDSCDRSNPCINSLCEVETCDSCDSCDRRAPCDDALRELMVEAQGREAPAAPNRIVATDVCQVYTLDQVESPLPTFSEFCRGARFSSPWSTRRDLAIIETNALTAPLDSADVRVKAASDSAEAAGDRRQGLRRVIHVQKSRSGDSDADGMADGYSLRTHHPPKTENIEPTPRKTRSARAALPVSRPNEVTPRRP